MIERRSKYRPLKTFLLWAVGIAAILYVSIQLYPG